MGFVSSMIQTASGETEVEYAQRIIDTICALDSRITCNTTAAAQYADSTSASTATFDIDIDNRYIFRLKRKNTNNNATTGFLCSIVVDGSEYAVSATNLRWWYTNSTANTVIGTGYFKVSAFLDDNNIFIWIGMHHDTPISAVFPTNYSTATITDLDDNAYAAGLNNSNLIADASYYKCDDGSTGYQLTKVLNFIDQAGTISYLQNMNAPIYSNGNPAKFAKGLIASSTRTLGESLFFDGKSYFAVGTNVLIENPAS
jgi:hypothetical protein